MWALVEMGGRGWDGPIPSLPNGDVETGCALDVVRVRVGDDEPVQRLAQPLGVFHDFVGVRDPDLTVHRNEPATASAAPVRAPVGGCRHRR